MTALSITVNAVDIPDMATQLLQLAQKFNGIAAIMGEDPHPSLNNAPSSPAVLAKTPLETAIAAQKAADTALPPAAEVIAPKDVRKDVKKGRKAAAAKEAAPPKDRFFEEEKQDAAADAAGDTDGAYTDEMPTEDCFVLMRARAKAIVDRDGLDTLKALWTKHWATIIPEAADQAPGVKHLEGNRDAILRALALFDAAQGIDPTTGEAVASDPAADLL